MRREGRARGRESKRGVSKLFLTRQNQSEQTARPCAYLGIVGDPPLADAALRLNGEDHIPVGVVDDPLEARRLCVEPVLDVGAVHTPVLRHSTLPPMYVSDLSRLPLWRELCGQAVLLVWADNRLGARLRHQECLAGHACRGKRIEGK